MRITILLLLNAIHGLFLCAQSFPGQAKTTANSQGGLEALFNEYYYNHHWQEDKDDDRVTPTFTFQMSITHATTLKELDKIQRKVRCRLGVKLTFRHIEFDSCGLHSLSIEAKSRTGKYGLYNLQLSESCDYGVFAVSYEGQRRWFIGSRSAWPECFHALLTRR